MRKGMIKQDSCYTPKYFGSFDYDPATTKQQAEYLNISNYDTIDTNGLIQSWNYNNIWLNPPFTLKFEFLQKAVEKYKNIIITYIFYFLLKVQQQRDGMIL